MILSAIILWHQLNTQNYVVLYPGDYEKIAIQVAKYLETYRMKVKEITGVKNEKLICVIEDMGLFSNGFALPPLNTIHIFTGIPSSDPHFDVRSWFRIVTLHEQTHCAHMRNYTGLSLIFRLLFGEIMSGNMWVPNWIVEGVTVYTESQIDKYDGRLNTGYYNAYLLCCAAHRKIPGLASIANNIARYPYYTQHYLFGGEFTQYLAIKGHLSSLYNDLSLFFFPWINIELSFFVNYLNFPFLLAERWRKTLYRKAKWVKNGKTLLKTNSEIKFLTIYGDYLYYVKKRVNASAPLEIVEESGIYRLNLENNIEEKLINAFVEIPFKIKDDKIYYCVDKMKRGYKNITAWGYGVYRKLISYDLQSGEKKKIYEGNIRSYEVLKYDKILIFEEDRLLHTSIKLLDNGKIETIGELDGKIILESVLFDSLIFCVVHDEKWGKDLYALDLKDMEIKRITKTPFSEMCISRYGDLLIFVANKDNFYKIYGYDVKRKRFYELLSETFSAYPVVYKDKIFYVTLHPEGEEICVSLYTKKDIDYPEFSEEYGIHPEEFAVKKSSCYANELRFLLPVFYVLFPPYVFCIISADAFMQKALGVFYTRYEENTYINSIGYCIIKPFIVFGNIERYNFDSQKEFESYGAGVNLIARYNMGYGENLRIYGIRVQYEKDTLDKVKIEKDVFVFSNLKGFNNYKNLMFGVYQVDGDIKVYFDYLHEEYIRFLKAEYGVGMGYWGSGWSCEYLLHLIMPVLKPRLNLYPLFFDTFYMGIFLEGKFNHKMRNTWNTGLKFIAETGTSYGFIKLTPYLKIFWDENLKFDYEIGVENVTMSLLKGKINLSRLKYYRLFYLDKIGKGL